MANAHLPSPSSLQDQTNAKRIPLHSSSSVKSGAVTYGKSWADDIQAYHRAKATLPWSPELQTPVKHVTRYEKSREEREYDLVLGKFRDAERELDRKGQDQQNLTNGLERGRAKQLRTIQRFNMINHVPMYAGAKDPDDKQPTPHPLRYKNAADYNIVSNLSHETGAISNPSPSRSPSRRPMREFNILSNKYHDRHEDRFQSEEAKAKQIAAIKFVKTHSFDPVRITYYDERKEETFLKGRQEEQAIHGKDRVLKLPPREQFSEGRLYNILNQELINEQKLLVMKAKDQSSLNKIKQTAEQLRMRDTGEKQHERDTALCLNRYAHERNTQAYVHGYDPISNQSFEGRDAKPQMPTRTHATLSAWQVLESGVPVHSKIDPQWLPKNPEDRSTAPIVRTAPSTKRPDANNEPTRKPNIMVVNSSAIESMTIAPNTGVNPGPKTPLVRTGGFVH